MNDNDRVIEETAYSPEGVPRHRMTSDYDDAGKLRSQVYFNGDGTISSKVTHEYDKWGNRIKNAQDGLKPVS